MNKLYLSDDARADLAEIKRYIEVELENPAAARSITRKIVSDIRSLETHAMLGAALRSIADVPGEYRFLVTGNYLTFYRISGTELYIDRILYGRRNYLDILLGDTMEKKTES